MNNFSKKWARFKLKIYRVFAPRLLWMQLFCILLFLTLIPLTFLIYTQWHAVQTIIKNPILQYNKDMASALTGEIEKSFSVSQKSLSGMAAVLGSIEADPWRQKIAITEMTSDSLFFKKIVSVNSHGQEISSSQEGAILKNRSDDLSWIEVKSGKDYISDVTIQEDHTPFLTISVPIKSSNELIGALIAEVDLRSIWEDVDNLRYGKTGRAYLVDQKGRIITHPDKKLIFKDMNPLFPEPTRNVISGHTGSGITKGPDGKNWLISYSPVQILNWGLIIMKSEEEIYSPFIAKIRLNSVLSSIPAALLSLIISYIAARLLVRPMHKFINETKKLLNGDLVKKYPVFRNDELGEIAFYFNRLIYKYYTIKDMENFAKVGEETSAVTHEIKNSLHMMRTYIKLLPKRHKDKKFMKEFIAVIPPELDSLKEKMQDIGNFVQSPEFFLAKIKISPFLNKIVLMNKFLIKEANIDFIMNPSPHNASKIFIEGDEFHLKRLFTNLFKNAIETTPPGGKIALSYSFCKKKHGLFQKEQPCLNIFITNTGQGIPKNLLETIFEPFFSTKKYGLGLGLSMCKQIVQRHNGKISVRSIENKETTFLVALPVSKIV